MNTELICKCWPSFVWCILVMFLLFFSLGERSFVYKISWSFLTLKALWWICRILDNLPVAVLRQRRDGSQSTTYEHGFRVGFKGNYQGVCLNNQMLLWKCLYVWVTIYLILQSKEEKYFINNHLSFRVMYHKDRETDSARIVGFEVTPNRFFTDSEHVYMLCYLEN